MKCGNGIAISMKTKVGGKTDLTKANWEKNHIG